MAAHTPGTWTIREEGVSFSDTPNGEWRIDDEHRMPVATAHGPSGGRSRQQAKANAHLIAAAPDLYDALNELYSAAFAVFLGSSEPRITQPLAKALDRAKDAMRQAEGA